MTPDQPIVTEKKKDVRPRDGSGNLISGKRQARRDACWPSGRQWRKIRKAQKANG